MEMLVRWSVTAMLSALSATTNHWDDMAKADWVPIVRSAELAWGTGRWSLVSWVWVAARWRSWCLVSTSLSQQQQQLGCC